MNICYIFSHLRSYSSPPLIYIFSARLFPASVTGCDAVICFPGQVVVAWLRWWIYGSIWLALSVFSFGACSLQVWTELQSHSCQSLHHMPSLLLLLHLKLTPQGLTSHCFLQTDLFGQMDEFLHAAPAACSEHQEQKVLKGCEVSHK